MPLVFSPEIYSRIVQCASSRRRDILALCLTSKAFQREAELRIYTNIILNDPHRAHLACRTLSSHERLALLVRTFYFTQETRRSPQGLPPPFWATMQGALKSMRNLEVLLLTDSTFSNTWILDPAYLNFQLYEAKLRFSWDNHLIKFLESQRKLRSLQIYDQMDEIVSLEIQPQSLTNLQILDGTLLIGVQFVSCPLTHMQLIVDTEPEQTQVILHKLVNVYKTLRGLSLLDIPDESSLAALNIISVSCPLLRHIGLFPLPMLNRHKFHHSLMRMHYLRSIELDIGRWNPHPTPAGQRALAAEIRTYCPNVRHIVFWIGNTKFRWTCLENSWQSRIDPHQYPQHGTLWCNA